MQFVVESPKLRTNGQMHRPDWMIECNGVPIILGECKALGEKPARNTQDQVAENITVSSYPQYSIQALMAFHKYPRTKKIFVVGTTHHTMTVLQFKRPKVLDLQTSDVVESKPEQSLADAAKSKAGPDASKMVAGMATGEAELGSDDAAQKSKSSSISKPPPIGPYDAAIKQIKEALADKTLTLLSPTFLMFNEPYYKKTKISGKIICEPTPRCL